MVENDINLNYWMTYLPDDLRNCSIVRLAIPGSHNSMSYGIDAQSEISPDVDSESQIKLIYSIAPCFIRRWSVTQKIDVKQQLQLGIRYFDLRMATKPNKKMFYCHGLYAMEWHLPLSEIKLFLDENPKELVILDFQHFYNMNRDDHRNLFNGVVELFGSSRFYTPRDGTLNQCSLNYCFTNKKQIIVIYRKQQYLLSSSLPTEFWPDMQWNTPWPNVCSIKKLQNFLTENLQERDNNIGYVSQCILTPSGLYISLRFGSSLESCGKRVLNNLQDWIKTQHAGTIIGNEPTINVIIADFVHLKNALFCQNVVGINYKNNISEK